MLTFVEEEYMAGQADIDGDVLTINMARVDEVHLGKAVWAWAGT